jgi:hypothetical protein
MRHCPQESPSSEISFASAFWLPLPLSATRCDGTSPIEWTQQTGAMLCFNEEEDQRQFFTEDWGSIKTKSKRKIFFCCRRHKCIFNLRFSILEFSYKHCFQSQQLSLLKFVSMAIMRLARSPLVPPGTDEYTLGVFVCFWMYHNRSHADYGAFALSPSAKWTT